MSDGSALPKPIKRRGFTPRDVASEPKRKRRQSMRDQVRVGMRFGHWEIMSAAPAKNGHSHFECRCVCGKIKSVMGGHLTSGRSTNCGCKKPGKYRHGQAGTRTHKIWQQMKSRCTNRKLPEFRHYGERGIRVCERWLTFENFLVDMGECPPTLSIDRIDNDKGYEPGNCRWATQREQCNNQRRTVRLTHNGQTLPLQQWADITGIDPGCLFWRYQDGWSHDRILTTPSKQPIAATIDGETLSLVAWAAKAGVPYQTMVTRKSKGWPDREVVFGRRGRGR